MSATVRAMNISLVIHGGADSRGPDVFSADQQQAMRAALQAALRAGHDVLRRGGPSLDAVTAAVRALEDCGQFDAGKGAYRNVDGGFDLDAAIMDGRTGAAGAAAHVHHVKNTVLLARAVMERTPHVLLVADGAERLARDEGLDFVDDDYFLPSAHHDPKKGAEGDVRPTGTVGAVALDAAGNVAAATSTGGTHVRLAGRVGDTPIIGAGTYADNAVGAISCTGEGEYFLRAVLAHDIAARVEYGGHTLTEAAGAAMREKLTARGGFGGAIGVDARGNPVMVFNTPTMARGAISGADGEGRVALFTGGM